MIMNFEQFKQLPMIKNLPIHEQNRLFFNYKSDRMYELASLNIATSSSSAAGAGGSGQLQSQIIDNNIIGPEISLEFYDINDSISFFGISDVNSVFEWNNILNFNDFPSIASFSDESGTTITFTSVEVIGNRIVLTPPNYTLVYGFKWNYFNSNNPKELLNKVRLTHPDVITGYLQISTNNVNLAENIFMSNPTLTDLANLEIYDLDEPTFDDNNLNLYTTFYIDNMDITTFNNNILSNISELTLQDRTLLTEIIGNDFSNALTINLEASHSLQTFSNNIAPLIENLYLTDSNLVNIDISGYPLLTDIYLIDNALTQSSVDQILSKLVDFELENGTLALENNSSGTNSAPSSQGLLDITTLESRGWQVTVAL